MGGPGSGRFRALTLEQHQARGTLRASRIDRALRASAAKTTTNAGPLGAAPASLSPAAREHFNALKTALGAAGRAADRPLVILASLALADLDARKDDKERAATWRRCFSALQALNLTPAARRGGVPPVASSSAPRPTSISAYLREGSATS